MENTERNIIQFSIDRMISFKIYRQKKEEEKKNHAEQKKRIHVTNYT